MVVVEISKHLAHNKCMQTDQQTATCFADPSACEALWCHGIFVTNNQEDFK